MPNLLVDMGNSRLKWAMDSDKGFEIGTGWLNSDISLQQLLAQHWRTIRPEHVLISCVGNKDNGQALSQAIADVWGIQAELLVSPANGNGLRNAYIHPERLGSDRWAAMVAAYAEKKGALCVVDCGTAVTLDAINTNGQHMGGMIVAGLNLSQQCLLQGTHMEFQPDNNYSNMRLLGETTEQCIQQGSYHQICSLINQTFQQLKDQMESMSLILTGGDAAIIQAGLRFSSSVDTDLVLKGLAIILRTRLVKAIS